MYATPSFAGLTQPLYNPLQIQGNLQFYVNTPDVELNQLTPMVATAAAQQFVQSLERNTPMRIAAYNYVAQNGFVNDYFRDFITKCMKAAYVAMEQNQTTSIQDVCSRMMPEWINMYSAALAMNTPGILSQVSHDIALSVQQLAQRYLHWLTETDVGLARVYDKYVKEGQLRLDSLGTFFQGASGNTTINHFQRPVQDLTKPSGFSTVVCEAPNGQVMQGTPSVSGGGYYSRKLQAENEAAIAAASQYVQQYQPTYSESTTSVMAGSTYVSPYAEKLRKEIGEVKPVGRWGGVAPSPSTAPAPTPVATSQQTIAQAAHVPNYGATAQDIAQKALVAEAASKQARDFDDSVMDFSTQPVKVVPPSPETHLEKKPIIASTKMNGETLNIVSILTDVEYKESGWKPNRFQPYFPCWCKRTHELLYVVADTGEVVAIPTPYNKEDIEKMFDYKAHAINPNLGKPTEQIEVPIREEAKALYSSDPESAKTAMDESTKISSSTGDLTQQCAITARRMFAKDPKLQMVCATGINYEHIGYDTAEELKEAYDQLRSVRLKVTYDSSAKAIAEITSPSLRKKVGDLFTQRFNSLLRDRLGVPGCVDSYVDEAAEASESIREHIGDIVADALVEAQSDFIAETIDVVMAEEIPDIATYRSMLTDPEDIKQFLETSLFLSTNHLVLTSRFTADELAIGAGEGASQLDADNYPVLHASIKKILDDEVNQGIRFESIELHTNDGFRYGIYRSALNKDIILVKAL